MQALSRLAGGIKALALLTSALALSGCVSFSADGGFGVAQDAAKTRLGKEVVWVKSAEEREAIGRRVAALLEKPLDVEDAVQLALLNNRGLQAAFFELGVSEAELVQAGRFPNPHFSMLRASGVEHGTREFKIEQALTFNILALVTIPLAVEVETRRFDLTKRQMAMDVLRLAADTRAAYFQALAAEESVRYMRQVKDVAEAAAELARRMAQAGNWNKLNQAREQGFYADAVLNLGRAEHVATATRERLMRMLGLWGEQTAIKLPERLPDLPKAANEMPDVEQRAMAERLDLQAIRLQTEALAKNLGLTRATRFINVLEIGPARVLEGPRDAPYKRGYEVSFQLPLFDFGGARVARAEAIYMQAVNRAAESAINARSEVRAAYSAYRSTYDIAKHHRDEIVPIRKRIAEENLLRYNGMLIGVFDLLLDAQRQIAAVNNSIEALRDFWLAEADLAMAMVGRPMLAVSPRAAGGAAEGAAH
jgi:outer membrane protein TolC